MTLLWIAACASSPTEETGAPFAFLPCAGPGTICTVAGALGPDLNGDGVPDGARGNNGEGLPALESWLYFPTGVAFGPADGLPHIVDYNGYRVRRIEADGVLRTVLGDGRHAGAVSGAPALESPIENPADAAFLADGTLLVTEQHTGRVIAVRDGTVEIYAGTGEVGYTSSGLPASESLFNEPTGIDVDAAGNVYVADAFNTCVRQIRADGTVWNVAGSLTPGFSDGVGYEVQFALPQHLAVFGGYVYVPDTGNHVIRRLDLATGVTDTVAGRPGQPGYAGDGGPAVDATLNSPVGLGVDTDGTLYIADSNNHVIRSIDASGTIHTIAGTGTAGWTGDGGPAADATLNWPNNVDVAPNGDLWVSDTLNSVVRRIEH
jgi:sugar lactone lactonase YvrE